MPQSDEDKATDTSRSGGPHPKGYLPARKGSVSCVKQYAQGTQINKNVESKIHLQATNSDVSLELFSVTSLMERFLFVSLFGLRF